MNGGGKPQRDPPPGRGRYALYYWVVFSSTETLSESMLATTRSGLRSAFMRARVMATGETPAPKTRGLPRLPSPAFLSTETLSMEPFQEPGLAVAMSVSPSSSKSASVRAYGPLAAG